MNLQADNSSSAHLASSVSHWLDGLRGGDSVAAQELWNRYFARLVSVA